MNEFPTWLTTAISTAIGAVITFLVSRRLYGASVDEKQATTLATMTRVSEGLAAQLEAIHEKLPVWKTKIEEAEVIKKKATLIQQQAAIIVEEVEALSYVKDPDEPESKAEKRFKAIKAAAKKIADCQITNGG